MTGTMKERMLTAAITAGTVKPIEGLPERMAQHEREVEAVERRPWLPAEQQRVIAEKEAALRTDIAALMEAARKRALSAFEQEEGHLRAQARATGSATDTSVRSQVFRHTRATQLAALVDRAGTPAEARRVYDEATLTADDGTIRLVGATVQQRLQTLAAVDKGKPISKLRDAAAHFEQEFGAWQRGHPSTVERLAQIDRARGNAALLFDESAAFALRLYGVGRATAAPVLKPVPDVAPAESGIRVAPGFDRLAAGK